MASRAKVRGGEKQLQSLSLGRETVEELEKEAERRGLNKSQLADLLLNGQLTQSADKPTIISIMSYKGGVAKTTTSTCLAVCQLVDDVHDDFLHDAFWRNDGELFLRQ